MTQWTDEQARAKRALADNAQWLHVVNALRAGHPGIGDALGGNWNMVADFIEASVGRALLTLEAERDEWKRRHDETHAYLSEKERIGRATIIGLEARVKELEQERERWDVNMPCEYESTPEGFKHRSDCRSCAKNVNTVRGERDAARRELEALRDIERLAELEHEQWMWWAKAVAPEVSEERRARWARLMVPYAELAEADKEHDRLWAQRVVRLHPTDAAGKENKP